jgi:hypothetical protein
MTPWTHALRNALVSGSFAAVTSTAALAALGKRDSGDAAAPINAISHWFWGDRAARVTDVDLRHTLAGYLTHHAAAIFWAVFFERWFGERARDDDRAALVGGAATAALAATVDYTITPKRLTPGYEKRLSLGALVLVYAAFGIGLALSKRARSSTGDAHAREYGAPLY